MGTVLVIAIAIHIHLIAKTVQFARQSIALIVMALHNFNRIVIALALIIALLLARLKMLALIVVIADK